MGRPPAGRSDEGKPEKTSQYPKLTVSIRPSTRRILDAVTTIEKRPAWRVVEDGIKLYVDGLSQEDRRIVEAIAQRTRVKRSKK